MGRQYRVSQSYVNVFSRLPRASGFCLSTLGGVFESSSSPSVSSGASDSERIRRGIGFGIVVWRSSEGRVFIFNRSDRAVFVQPPPHDDGDDDVDDKRKLNAVPRRQRSLPEQGVFKLTSGRCAEIYDLRRRGRDDGDHHRATSSVRVSFVKGWGSGRYKRMTVLTCPCWLEILLRRDGDRPLDSSSS